MKGKVGIPRGIYHTRLPDQWELKRMVCELSKEAILRLRWIDHYIAHGNARLPCRHFGISHTTFLQVEKRFDKRGLKGLESLSRAPKRRRISSVPWHTVDLIVKIRGEYPPMQERAGKDGKVFTLYILRSMRISKEQSDVFHGEQSVTAHLHHSGQPIALLRIRKINAEEGPPPDDISRLPHGDDNDAGEDESLRTSANATKTGLSEVPQAIER